MTIERNKLFLKSSNGGWREGSFVRTLAALTKKPGVQFPELLLGSSQLYSSFKGSCHSVRCGFSQPPGTLTIPNSIQNNIFWRLQASAYMCCARTHTHAHLKILIKKKYEAWTRKWSKTLSLSAILVLFKGISLDQERYPHINIFIVCRYGKILKKNSFGTMYICYIYERFILKNILKNIKWRQKHCYKDKGHVEASRNCLHFFVVTKLCLVTQTTGEESGRIRSPRLASATQDLVWKKKVNKMKVMCFIFCFL